MSLFAKRIAFPFDEDETIEARFEPPVNAPDEPLPMSEFWPAIEENKIEDFNYDFIDTMRKSIPENWWIAKSENDINALLTILRRYHIPFTLRRTNSTVLDFATMDDTESGYGFSMFAGSISFTWKEMEFIAFSIVPNKARVAYSDATACFIASSTMEALKQIVNDINLYEPSTEGRILVYRGGWDYNSKLRNEISHLTWDDLVLPVKMKKTIRESAERFFQDGGAIYQKLGTPYKRGFLLVGEPGSGKSLTAKIMAATLPCTFIYVLSLGGRFNTANEGIVSVFKKAKQCAPCVICFEDLDSQIDSQTRTEFLNALDGFETMDGVLTIATTNHPENIDVALTNRPSRFDRKWVYPNPSTEQRTTYLRQRVARLLETTEAEFSTELLDAVKLTGKSTKKHSYAMLQELVVTAGYEHFLNNVAFIEALAIATESTNEQIKMGAGEKLAEMINDEEELGFRIRDDD